MKKTTSSSKNLKARNKSLKTQDVNVNEISEDFEKNTLDYSLKPKKPTLKSFYFPVAILAIAAIIYFGKGFVVAAMVNNQPVSRLGILAELEKTQGRKILDQKINEILILQEGRNNNLQIKEQDIADRVGKIEEQVKQQGQSLDDALKTAGMTKEELNDQVRMELIVEKILGDKVQITDEEIKTSFDENKAYYPEGTTLDTAKEDIRESLRQQKLSTEFTTWIQDLKNKAKINYFVSY